MDVPLSLFARFIGRQRSPWVTLGFALLLLVAGLGAALMDSSLSDLFRGGGWRAALLPPAVILYILAVAPEMARMEAEVLASFRPLVALDDESMNRVVAQAAYVHPRNEGIAVGLGIVVGLWSARQAGLGAGTSWLVWYWLLTSTLMYGLLAWTIYSAVAGTRLTAALHRQPLRIDILDATPFRPIGRQSLLVALVFVGGITLSLVFVALDPQSLQTLQFWLIYIPLVLVPPVVFFLNMGPTHRVLVSAKERELAGVRRRIHRAYRALAQRMDENKDTGGLAAEINALVAYEQRVQAASTWPYDTAMLRTLFVSVLVPGGTVVVQLAKVLLAR